MRRTALDVAWAAALALAATAILVHGGGLWGAVTSGDLHVLHEPKYEYAARRLFHEGALALWNPWDLCGVPILATTHGQALYPPTLLSFALWSPWTALQVVIGVHVFVLSLGLTAYLRGHGSGRVPAAIATMVALAGVLTTSDFVGVDHPGFLTAVAWVPAILLFAERGSIGGMALASGAQWLAGYPEVPMTTVLLASTVVVIAGPASWGARLRTIVLGFGLGALVGAVQILPLLEAIGESTRAAVEWQFPLWRARSGLHALSDVVTRLSARQGWAALVLAAVALVTGRPRTPRIAWAVALVWCVVALNRPFDLLYVLPGLRGVRFGYAWSAIAGVFVGVLVADGFARLEGGRAWWPWVGRGLAAVVLLAGIRILEAAPGLDFPNVGLRFEPPDQSLIAERLPTLRRWLDTAPGARLVSERELVAAAGLRHGLRMAVGHEPAVPPRRVAHLLEEAGLVNPLACYRDEHWVGAAARPEILALLSVRFVVVPRGAAGPFLAAGFVRRAELPPGDVLLEGPTLPRARLVHRVAVAGPTDEATLAALYEHAGEASELAVVDRLPPDAPSPQPGDTTGEHVAIVEDAPDRVVIEVTASAAALLVLADTWYPGWVADVDGAPAEIVRADHAFRGVVVPAGRHRVVFRYAPLSVRLGGAASVAGLVVVLALALRRARSKLARTGGHT